MEKSDFQKEYGFEKPSKSQRLIFSCQLGARAYSAAVAANSMGYNAYYYPGSWAEWSAKLAK
jgi:3-mercaptopyruvate sulfurtransferase SseA